ncbi:MAG: malonyl-CoA decarboxylase [Paracoccaceae bacterium]
MVQTSFLGDMLNTLIERRRIKDTRPVEQMCEALLAAEGEVSGMTLAKAILDHYAGLDDAGKLGFFQFLNDALDLDADALADHAREYADSKSLGAYQALSEASEPRRQELLRRLNQSSGATAALVNMRTDLRRLAKDNPDLKRTDMDFLHLLRSWFNRGFLVLRRIDWNTPATILEKIVAYEAVHEIESLDDLRRRLHPEDRLCYAYFHPTMPDEPLIFIEVALSDAIPSSVQDILAKGRTPLDATKANVAVFYSISNCQIGLQGVSFGNLLIKQVVEELSLAHPQLDTFVTLSPIPGFNRWKNDSAQLSSADTALAAHYLLNERAPNGTPLDPVARFHLGNGAQIHAVHADADTSANGQAQSNGVMANYLYDTKAIEKNHAIFLSGSALPASKAIMALANEAKPLLRDLIK